MTSVSNFVRAPRRTSARCEVVDIPLAAPPPVPQARHGRGIARWVSPLILLAGTGFIAALAFSGVMQDRGLSSLMFPVMMIGSTLATVAYSALSSSRNADLDRDRDDYLAYLADIATRLDDAAVAQRDQLFSCQPGPGALCTIVGTDRMWERRPADADFGVVRIGVGTVGALTRPVAVEAREPQASQDDPVTAEAHRRFLDTYSTVPDTPITVPICAAGIVMVDGDDAAAIVRAMLCQLAVWHSPSDVTVAVVSDGPQASWDWVKWLPHNRYREVGPPMFYRDLASALDADHADHVVVLVDGWTFSRPPSLPGGVTILAVGSAATGTGVAVTTADGSETLAQPDRMSASAALSCARLLAGYRAGGDRKATGWLAQMGIGRIDDIPKDLWDGRSVSRLRVPIGSTPQGDLLELDINEPAEHGVGPHGLCVGATGSGKSELLRTIALGMIAGHSPEALNLILVDFKGGATFLDLGRAPHVASVITNLADEAHLVERMQDALLGEIHRRQQLLRAAGNFTGIADYRRAGARGGLPPLPALLIIVDEFSELLSTHPEFIDTFVAIGRLGRSLGMHLLLASQRLDDGRLRGLESHLSYRICLKTLSVTESRAVLGVPDAYELPTVPGAAILKAGAADPMRFQSAYVSGPVALVSPVESSLTPELFVAEPIEAQTTSAAVGATVIEDVLSAVAGHGPAAHPIWLAPLDASPALDRVLADAETTDLTVPIGFCDYAFEQRRSPMLVDLAGSAGNVAVVGAPQSGKTTALRTLILALAATHDPHRVQVYCLDMGGGLAALAGLPHVGSLAGRRDTDLVLRTVAEITAIARRREASFAELGVGSISQYRRRLADGDLADPFGDVFLVIDGWSTLRQQFDGLESAITSVAAEGLSLGIHVVLSASRWADLRPGLKDQIGTRIELRLGDPVDSEIDRKRASNVPVNRPGRGLTPEATPLTVALPRLDGESTTIDLAGATGRACRILASRYSGRRAPAIAVLPAHVDYHALADHHSDRRLPLGLQEDGLTTVAVDFGEQAHMLILGDSGSGKTAALRTLCHGIRRGSAAQLVLVDPRRSLAELDGADRVIGYGDTPERVMTAVDDLLTLVGTGDLYLVVDDYELIGAGTVNPLTPLLAVLPRARDAGLHLVIARRSAGASRALYEPVLAAVRESDAMGLQLSTGVDEGAVLGRTRPRPLPPGRGILSTRAAGDRLVQVAWTASR